jgi:DNA topoisomerase-2
MTSKKSIEDTYQKMSPIEHILALPDTYIGDVTKGPIELWVYDDSVDRIIKKTVNISLGLYKIFDEIIVNALDQYIRLESISTRNKLTEIKVNFNQEDGSITVYNNGDGIDIIEHKEHNIYIPEMIFGNLLTSTNYDKDEKRVTGGKNGYGAKLTNIFSSEFTIETIDFERKLKYKQVFTNNMSEKSNPKIRKSQVKPYTFIKFKPDFARFGMTSLDDDILSVMKKRVYDMSACTGRTVSVYLNNTQIQCKSFEKYVNMYIGDARETPRAYELVSDRWEIVVCTSPDDKLEQVSFVNGICTFLGGKHVEHVATKVAKKLSILVSKKKGKNKAELKQSHIKDNTWVFVKCLIENPSFDSQTKQNLNTVPSKFGSVCEMSDKFIDKLCRSTDIVTKAISLSNYKQVNTVAKTDGKKKNNIRGIPKLDDANWAGTKKSAECTLILTEGDSAKAFAIAGLSIIGRDRFGVFPLKGKLLNVRDMTDKRVCENEEINNLKKIIGLQQYQSGTDQPKVYTDLNELRYGSILILTDQDVDGSHIKGLLINVFHYYWSSLLQIDGFIRSMATPIVKLNKHSNTLSFYTLTDYENWKQNNNISGWHVKYYKGLGTSTSKEVKEYFKEFEQSKIQYTYTEADSETINLAFNKSLTNERKNWLGGYDRELILNQNEKSISMTDFINKDLIHFSNYDNQRSIPCICDGLKPSQRKVLYGILLKNVKNDIKVSQITGYISEKSCYHHGEMSLHGTIISMAHNFVGSNNIELLVPSGQFGSRLKGGKDSASPRYIFTRMTNLTPIIFQNSDSVLLNYLDDDGATIEPEWYLPIIPMILVNGTEGIGTGFSTKVPCFNPLEIVRNIKRFINGKSYVTMAPYYRGFIGTIVLNEEDNKYYSHGIYTRIDDTTIEITELPIGEWTDDYKEYLEKLIIDKGGNSKLLKDQCLVNYDSHYTEYNVRFILKFNKETLDTLLEDVEKFEKKFKLVNSKSTGLTNMHLYNRDGYIQKYNTIEEIMREFYDIRLEFYEKRRNYLLEKLQHEINIILEKIRFIEGVINDTLIIFHKEDEEIIQLLEENNFIKIDDSYDYLINMSLRNLTKRKIEEFKKLHENKIVDFDLITSKTITDLWIDDLDNFISTYNKMLVSYNKEYVDRVTTRKIKVIRKKK